MDDHIWYTTRILRLSEVNSMSDNENKKVVKNSVYGEMLNKMKTSNNSYQKGNKPKPQKGHSSQGVVKRTGRGR